MSPDEFNVWQQREQAHQRRDATIHAAAIRAALYAARGLSPATGCDAAMSGPALCTPSSPEAQGAVCAPSNSVRCRTCEHCAEPVKPCVCTEVGACATGGCCGACRERFEVLRLPSDDTEGGPL